MGEADPARVAASSDGSARMLQRLVERIRRGSCVLVLGPGVAVDADGADRTPLTSLISRQLADDPQVARLSPQFDPDNLRQTAELFYQSHRDRDELNLTVAEFYGRYENSTTPFHVALADLPFRLCICTTPDKLLYNAFARARVGDRQKQPVVGHYSLRSPRSNRPLPEPTEIAPVIYHLYGQVDEPSSLVLTENDLIEFLVAVVRADPPPPDMIRGKLGLKDTEFLFVGFGFLNWYVRVLLHVLNVYGHNNRPMALEDQAFFSHPEHSHAVMFFSGERSIEFQQFSWTELATRLRETYLATAKPEAVAQPGTPSGAPRAFLCYASEDRAAVERLGSHLQKLGIGMWQDKQNLRAGDNWDRALVRVIENQVDYVIVCQSTVMDTRVTGYYHKEIEVALEQQRLYRPPFRFVVAAALEPCTGLESLKHVHFVNVQTDEGADALARSILEDWNARRGLSTGDIRAPTTAAA